MKRNCVFAFVTALGLAALAVYGQNGGAPATDDAALKQGLTAYEQAYNKRDLPGLLSFWAANAEFVNEAGESTSGRDSIGELFRKNWKDNPGATLKLKNASLRFLKPDVAMQTGVAELKTPGGDVDASPYEALWLKTDGKWQLSRVRDLPDSQDGKGDGAPTSLRDLEWLVGEWVYDEAGTKVELSARWFKNRAFLVIDQTVFKNGEETLTLTTFVGWDAGDQKLRSWLFDSRGGMADGVWTREGNQWNVDASGTLADGRSGSALNAWKFLTDDRFEWSSTNREIDGRPSADIKIQYVRKAKR